MKIYYVCSTSGLRQFSERVEAENVFNFLKEHDYEPLFLIVEDVQASSCTIDRMVLA